MDKKNNAVIYGIKKDNKYYYIGKLRQSKIKDNNIKNCDITTQYQNQKLRNVFTESGEILIESLKNVPDDKWFDEKLIEIVNKHKDNHPLLNAQWMLEGKRGYWSGTGGYWKGRKKDQHTLNRLSESKHKQICQYDINGNLIKTWNSGKEVALKIFKDYRIKNGSARSRLYSILGNKKLKRRFIFNSYWFRSEELITLFKTIPQNLDFDFLKNQEKERIKKYKKTPREFTSKFSIIRYDDSGNIIKIYYDIHDCVHDLKIGEKQIRKICRGKTKLKNYQLQYGEKTKQPINSK